MPALNLLGVGAAHMVRIGTVSGERTADGWAPGTMRQEIGGGAFLALRAAARAGISTTQLSVRGGDADGEAVARALRDAKVADLSATFLDRATPSLTMLHDAAGRPAAGVADTALYDLALPKLLRRRSFRDAAEAADALLSDASVAEDAHRRLASFGKPLYGLAEPSAAAARFRDVLPVLDCLFADERAAGALAVGEDTDSPALLEALRRLGLRGAVIVTGARTISGFDAAGNFAVSVREDHAPLRVEALAGGTAAAMMRGASLREAVQRGAAPGGRSG